MSNRQTRSLALPNFTDRTIGRQREIADLQALLRDAHHRLVTLTGPGGVGKTRLAIGVADSLQDNFDLGVRFLSLAPVRDPARLPREVQIAFGLSSGSEQSIIERVATSLGDQSVLLVFDNLEQIIEAGVFLHDLVSACETVTALVTSRAPLRVTGEYEYVVPPLGLPETSAPPEDLAATDAVALFRERANHLADTDLEPVAEMCRRLDGLPLAIELAAARTRVFSPSELLDRLDQRLPLLTQGPRNAPPRLRSMAGAIAWSYDLLSSDEQALFRTLSVFEGGFTMVAAEAMAPDSPTAPVDLVGALADHSLVQRQDGEYGPRFIMLETVREFGLATLAERGEITAARDRHSTWLAEKLGSAFSEDARHQRQILYLPGDHENLRAAVRWALAQHRPEQAADLAQGLSPYWARTANSNEAVATWEMILAQCQLCSDDMKAGLVARIGGASYLRGDFERARHCATTALELHRKRESLPGVCGCLSLLGLISRWSDPDASVDYFTSALSVARTLGDVAADGEFVEFNLSQGALSMILVGNIAGAREHAQEALARLQNIADGTFGTFNRPISIGAVGWIAGMEGDLDIAEACAREQMALSEQFSVKEGMWYAHRIFGEVAFARHDLHLALKHFQQSLDIIDHSGIFLQWRSLVLAELAMTAAELGDADRAARLWGSAAAISDRLQFAESTKRFGTSWTGRYSMPSDLATDHDVVAAFEEGRNLSDAQSYALATDIVPSRRAQQRDHVLTSRQLDVLKLIEQGYTNREIAERLFISPRTVDRHVSSIFNALGAPTRTAAVAEARKQRLLGEDS